MIKSFKVSVEVTHRRQRVMELFLRGHKTQTGIIRELAKEGIEVSNSTVSKDFSVIIKEMRASAVEDYKQAINVELAKISLVELECWAAWDRSKGQHSKQRTSQKVTPKGDEQHVAIESEELAGDPRYIDQILKCIETRCRIKGLFAPTKIAPTTPDGKDPYVLAIENCSEEELRVISRISQRTVTVEHRQTTIERRPQLVIADQQEAIDDSSQDATAEQDPLGLWS